MEFTAFWVILIVLGVIILWLIMTYNQLVKYRNRVKEAWSDIDVQLKRRYNLIPNLLESVKGYMKHEEGVLTQVTQARTMAMGAQTPGEHAQTETMLSGALKSLFAVSENYPDLKASQNFLDLQQNLTDAEDKIQASRRFFNANTRDYNTKLESFPTNMIAKIFGFQPEVFYDAPEEAEAVPKITF